MQTDSLVQEVFNWLLWSGGVFVHESIQLLIACKRAENAKYKSLDISDSKLVQIYKYLFKTVDAYNWIL